MAAEARDRVFISYRRSDAAGDVTALRQSLVDRFGEDAIFRDVTDIDPGERFPDKLKTELGRAAVVLAVIGKDWLLATNEWNQRRIDLPNDWVTKELSTALAAPNVTVIPVLVGDAPMPPAAALPASLRGLAARNAVRVRHEDWDASLQRLLDRLGELLGSDAAATDLAAPEALTLDSIRQVVQDAVRQGVLEAMGTARQPSARDVVDALTELAGLLLADAGEVSSDEESAVQKLLEQLLGEPAADVSEHAAALFPHSFSHQTPGGIWIGYARDMGVFAAGDVERYDQCLLLRPDQRGRVAGAAVVARVVSILFPGIAGYPGHHSPPLVSAGQPLHSEDASEG